MSLLKIVTAPDDLLDQKSLEVKVVDDKIKTLAIDMLDTMYHNNGIGLAAVQIGILLRIIVVDVDYNIEKNNKTQKSEIVNQKQYIMINPIITSHSSEDNKFTEGCLSFPEQKITVIRPKKINVDYIDINGQSQSITADDILATCIQHEIDHLNGITIPNYVSSFKRELIMKKLAKLKKDNKE